MKKLTDQQIIDIFHEEGDTSYFREKYNVCIRTVKSIKSQESHKHITEALKNPGQITKYGLNPRQVDDIYYSKESYADLAKKYDIHIETVRNIKHGFTRTYEEWF